MSAVLEGSVRKSGDQLRITAQLNRSPTARTCGREPTTVNYATFSQCSGRSPNPLRINCGWVRFRTRTHGQSRRLPLIPRGPLLFNQHLPPDSYQKAIERYKQAIERDPKFTLAYSGSADAYAYQAENFDVAPRSHAQGQGGRREGHALDDSLGESHASLGIVKLDYEWDREGAQREFRSYATEPRLGDGRITGLRIRWRHRDYWRKL